MYKWVKGKQTVILTSVPFQNEFYVVSCWSLTPDELPSSTQPLFCSFLPSWPLTHVCEDPWPGAIEWPSQRNEATRRHILIFWLWEVSFHWKFWILSRKILHVAGRATYVLESLTLSLGASSASCWKEKRIKLSISWYSISWIVVPRQYTCQYPSY